MTTAGETPKLPSRKELRLARQRAAHDALVNSQKDAEEPVALQERSARAKHEETVALRFAESGVDTDAVPTNGTVATEVMYKVSDGAQTPAERDSFNSKFLGVAKQGRFVAARTVRKNPVLATISFASVIALVTGTVFSSTSAVGNNVSDAVLSSVAAVSQQENVAEGEVLGTDAISENLRVVAGSQAQAKVDAEIEEALAAPPQCEPKAGASSVASAFVDDSDIVYYPMKAGTFTQSSHFGYRTDPLGQGTRMHDGTDWAAKVGTPIYAVADGEVMNAGPIEGSINNTVVIKHEVQGKVFYSWYLHMWPDGILVEVGQKVKAGDLIAKVGNQGRSVGAHLHFEIRDGATYDGSTPVEPLGFIRELGAKYIGEDC